MYAGALRDNAVERYGLSRPLTLSADLAELGSTTGQVTRAGWRRGLPRARAWVGKFPPARNPRPRARVGGLVRVFFSLISTSAAAAFKDSGPLTATNHRRHALVPSSVGPQADSFLTLTLARPASHRQAHPDEQSRSGVVNESATWRDRWRSQVPGHYVDSSQLNVAARPRLHGVPHTKVMKHGHIRRPNPTRLPASLGMAGTFLPSPQTCS
jgi:hypothetical protein